MGSIILKLLLIGSLITIAVGCKHTKKPFMQRIDECTYDGRMNENTFYLFDTSEFKIIALLKYFREGIKMDSAYDKFINGDTIVTYTFKDDNSKVVFSLFNLSKGRRNFDVSYLQIRSDLMVFKNGIKINMSRSDFFNTLGIKKTDCDTFDIDLGQKLSGRYFRFVFSDEKLKSIGKEYVQ
jgi:hypothetical protein